MISKTNQTVAVIRLSILTAGALTVLKLVTGLMTHSMAVLASALDSAMDMATSIVNFLAAREAAKPPDDDHAYGHGKIESLASLFQSLSIGLSGLYIVVESARRLIKGSFIEDIYSGIAVMGVSIIITLFLTFRLKAASKQNASLILSTETLHYSTDILSNVGVLLALILIKFTGFVFLDLLFSIAIAGYIFKTSYGILRRAIDELLDHSLPPVSKEEIQTIIDHFNPQITGFHNFRSRKVGEQIFMDFHIEIRGERDFNRAHDLTESLIRKIREKYPNADVTVHYDPEGAE